MTKRTKYGTCDMCGTSTLRTMKSGETIDTGRCTSCQLEVSSRKERENRDALRYSTHNPDLAI